MAKLKVTQTASSFGNQVFSFQLANGRTLELEFCPHMMNEGGSAICAVVSLAESDGKKVPVRVRAPGSDPATETVMSHCTLWFANDAEEKEISENVRTELDAVKEAFETHFGPDGPPAK